VVYGAGSGEDARMTSPSILRPTLGWRLVRAVLSLAALAVVGAWLLYAWLFLVLRCDESCSGDQAESWVYPGQAVLAVTGAALALVAIALGFTRRRRGSRVAAAAAVVALVTWLAWLFLGGF
jgi:hypothetical protein